MLGRVKTETKHLGRNTGLIGLVNCIKLQELRTFKLSISIFRAKTLYTRL